jgi:2-polyprenyl-3-methyl-5-hydroxy-6-metoxy-1,4-benzoquinol methylase
MNADAKFWNRHARGYAKRPVADQAGYERKLEITRDYLSSDMEVLEFGCGTGSTAIALGPFVRHIRATDISDGMLEIAQEKAVAAGVTNVTFEQVALEEIAAADESYDAILGHSILHLVADRQAAIADVYRMLKPGGVFISSTSCLRGMMPGLRFVLPIGHFFGLLPAVSFFTVDDLKADIAAAGFEIDHQRQPGPKKAVFIVAKKR